MTILFVLLLLAPTLVVGVVLGRLLLHERERLAHAVTLTAEAQTCAVANQVQVAREVFRQCEVAHIDLRGRHPTGPHEEISEPPDTAPSPWRRIM